MILPNIWKVICQVTFQTTSQVLVSWDDDIPNIWKIQVMFQTTNQ